MRGLLVVITIWSINIQIFSQRIDIATEVKMLALGDSYTIGESVALNERWPHQFVVELRKLGVIADDPDYIATTGWTTKNLLEGMEMNLAAGKRYNLVSILIGVNNQYQGIDITTYSPDLKLIIEHALGIVDQDPSRVFMLSIPDYAFTPFGLGNPIISQEIDAYNAVNREFASKYNITWVDVTPISRKGIENSDLVASDGLHPSSQQYKTWVQRILTFIE